MDDKILNISDVEAEQFQKEVLSRYQTLIDLNIYPLSMTDLRAWSNNFTEPAHRYLATHILDRLIYRSYKMARASYSSFLISVVKDIYYDFFSETSIDNIACWQQRLFVGGIDKLVVVPIRLEEDSGASGDTVCRMVGTHSSYTKLLTKNGFQNRQTTLTSKIPSDYVILLVDDLLGSGDQIEKFSKQVNLKEWCNRNKVIYAPLISLEDGLETARGNLPFLSILPLEILERDQCFFTFSEGGKFICDDSFSESDAIQTYEKMLDINGMLKLRGGRTSDNCFGRNKSALTLSFEWGCPNQALSILWWTSPTRQDWDYLFTRRGS